MKAIIEFNLPEEAIDHKMAINGQKYYVAIESTLQFIRSKLKHHNLTAEQEKILEEIRDFLNEEMQE